MSEKTVRLLSETATADDTRDELIEAAWRLFGTHGYNATSVQSISDSAGVSRRTFYRRFDNKEQLLEAVVEKMARRAMDEMAPLLVDESVSAPERVGRFLTASKRWKTAQFPLVRDAVRVLLRSEDLLAPEGQTQSVAAGVWQVSRRFN